jgi:hypothetical protein
LLADGIQELDCLFHRVIPVPIVEQNNWTIETLTAQFLGRLAPEFSSARLTGPDREPLREASLDSLAPGTRLFISYPPALPNSLFHFADTRSSRTLSLRIPPHFDVLSVKQGLLGERLGRRNALPSLRRLTFWDCELQDSDPFFAYGIPEGVRVGYTEQAAFPVRVDFADGSSADYLCSAVTQFRDLREFVRIDRRLADSQFGLTSGGTELPDSQIVADLPTPTVLVFAPRGQMHTFATPSQPVSVFLKRDASYADAKSALSTQLGVAQTAIRFAHSSQTISDESHCCLPAAHSVK